MNIFSFDFIVENVTKYLSRTDGLNVILTSKSAHDNLFSFIINHNSILCHEINLEQIKNKEYIYDRLWIELRYDIFETIKLLKEKYPFVNKIYYNNLKDMQIRYSHKSIAKIMEDNGIELMAVCSGINKNNLHKELNTTADFFLAYKYALGMSDTKYEYSTNSYYCYVNLQKFLQFSFF